MSSSRFFIDRSFTLKGIGTILTGSFFEGKIKKGMGAQLWLPGGKAPKDVHIKSLRRHETFVDECAEPARLAMAIDGAKPSEIPRGSVLLWGDEFRPSKSLVLELDWAVSNKKQLTALVQVGTLTLEAKLRLHPKGFWRCTTEYPVPWRQGDRVLIRLPERIKNLGHTVAGGRVLEPPTKKPSKTALPAVTTVKSPRSLDPVLLQTLKAGKWEAIVRDEELDSAHALVKAGAAFCIKENQFLHAEHYEGLVAWLNGFFDRKADLSIEDAREFFKTGRKNFLRILEFCDRQKFTFRKDLVRKKFKLPSCSHPSGGPP